jgi:hypothetical protein
MIPAIHDFVDVFGIIGSELAVNKLSLGDVVIGGSVPAQLRLHKQAVSGAIPWHIAGFVRL